MYMGIAVFLFAGFFLNVFLGASGGGLHLSEVSEMLVLTTSVLFFVAAILKREAAAKKITISEEMTSGRKQE
jgi:hypothetical protein